jgi:hypothetical protein
MTSEAYREQIYKSMKESEHQERLVHWLRSKNIYFEQSSHGIFLPNPHPKNSRAYYKQRNSNATVMSKQKKEGLAKGVADLKIYLPTIELNIELKSMTGRASKEQLLVLEKYKSFTYAEYAIVKGYKNAIELIESYI